jgi:hypothetical protein
MEQLWMPGRILPGLNVGKMFTPIFLFDYLVALISNCYVVRNMIIPELRR